jgi:hypothetical protein
MPPVHRLGSLLEMYDKMEKGVEVHPSGDGAGGSAVLSALGGVSSGSVHSIASGGAPSLSPSQSRLDTSGPAAGGGGGGGGSVTSESGSKARGASARVRFLDTAEKSKGSDDGADESKSGRDSSRDSGKDSLGDNSASRDDTASEGWDSSGKGSTASDEDKVGGVPAPHATSPCQS